MQLKLAGKLSEVRGIVFGEMIDCRQSATQDYTLEEVVLRVVGDLEFRWRLDCARAMFRARTSRSRWECARAWRLAAR